MKKRMVAIALILSALVLILCGCGGKQDFERTLRIATQDVGFGYYANAIMRELGLLEKHLPEGVTVEWHNIVAANEMRDSLIAGQVDLTGFATLSVATALQNDFPLVFVAHIGAVPIKLYSNNPDITSMADLTAEHRISVPTTGTTTHTAFLIGAENDLGSAELFDNSMTLMANADAMNALISETAGVDAVVSPFPTLLAAEAAENVHLVRDLSDEVIDYGIGTVTCTTETFAEENPDILDAYLMAFDDAVKAITDDRETCLDILINTYEGCDEALANEMLDFFLLTVEYDGEKYDKLMSFMYDHGLLDEPAAPFAEVPKYTGSTR